MMTEGEKIRQIPKAVGIDIGGFTSDFLLMRSGAPCLDYCDSMEKGVITMYNDIISSVNGDHDMLLEETDIDQYPGRQDGILSGYGGTYGRRNGPEFCDRLAQQCPGAGH